MFVLLCVSNIRVSVCAHEAPVINNKQQQREFGATDKKWQNRIERFGKIRAILAGLSDEKLQQMLVNAKPIHTGIGGSSNVLIVDEVPVFVKKVPLTDLEHLSQNFMSTANLFDLPLCYQYGVGSAGFGAWREVAAHDMTTQWVINGECANFPLMYHWRVLPKGEDALNGRQSDKDVLNDMQSDDEIEQYCQYWDNSSAVKKRAQGLNQASAYIALCIEYVPQTLQKWLGVQIAKGGDAVESAFALIEEQAKDAISHMNTHGLMHFDAHFENILTDGELLYFTDFGLALSSMFTLTKTEKEFLQYHHLYDRACAPAYMLASIFTTLFAENQWEAEFRNILAGKRGDLHPAIIAIVKRHAALASVVFEFFQKLEKESKSTPYPALQLEELLRSSCDIKI